MNRYNDRGQRTSRRREESEDKQNLYSDAYQTGYRETQPRRRRSQAARLAMEETGEYPRMDEFSQTGEYSRTGEYARPRASASARGREDDEDGYRRPRDDDYARPSARAGAASRRKAADADDLPEPQSGRGRRKGDAPPSRKPERPKVRKVDDDFDSEYDDDFDGDDFYDDEPPKKRHIVRWVVSITIVVLLLAGLTFLGKSRPDLVEGVVQKIQVFISGPTPEPTPEPTPVPTPEPTPEPLPDKKDAAINTFAGSPLIAEDVGTPVVFQVTTSAETDKVQLVDSNGTILVESIGTDYVDTDEGRLWNLMVSFSEPYDGPIEAYPGNADGFNENRGGLIPNVKIGTMPEVPEEAGAAATGAAAGLSASMGTPLESVPLTDQVFLPTGPMDTPFARAVPITMRTADLYDDYVTLSGKESAGMNGVLTFRGSNMRENAAFGTVAPVEKKLSSQWQADAGVPMDGSIAFGSQPLIVQWHEQIREHMTSLNADKIAKKSMKEVIFPANDGSVYFFDMDDGMPSRAPLEVDPKMPMVGAASVYPRGIPALFVGTGNPVDSIQAARTGMLGYNLMTNEKYAQFWGDNPNSLSSDQTYITSPIFDNLTDTVLAVGGPGLFYTALLNAKVDQTDFSVNIAPSGENLSAKAEGEDGAVRSALAAYGEYAYFATQGGILKCININTMATEWAMTLGQATNAAIALDANEAGSPILYTATVADAGGMSYIRSLNALSGDLAWEATGVGSIDASPLIGQNAASELVYFATTDTTAGTLYALNKKTGDLAWEHTLGATKGTSPIALYDTEGNGYIVQGDNTGLYLLDAVTGEQLHYMPLEGAVVGSPAAFENTIVVATEIGKLFGIKLQ